MPSFSNFSNQAAVAENDPDPPHYPPNLTARMREEAETAVSQLPLRAGLPFPPAQAS